MRKIFYKTLFTAIGVVFFANHVLASPGAPCTSDAQCSDTPNNYCIFGYGVCSPIEQDIGCLSNANCTPPASCNTTKRLCEGAPTEDAINQLCDDTTPCSLPNQVCVLKQCVYGEGGPCSDNQDCAPGLACPKTGEKKCISLNSPTIGASPSKPPFIPIAPRLQINIPTLQPFNPNDIKIQGSGDDRYLLIPFIQQYIVALYKYGISISFVIAIVMIMIAGFRWMTSAGNTGTIGQAKTMIGTSVIGIVLLLGSYVLLYTINPDLVKTGVIKIKYIEGDPLAAQTQIVDRGEAPGENIGEAPGESVPSAKSPKAISNTTYDELFQKYAPCAGLDWRVLKAFAYKESSLDANLVNKFGFTGLFQFRKDTCPSSIGARCDNLTDPDNNTAAMAVKLKKHKALVDRRCPNATPQVFYTLLYMAHNSGPGAVDCATKNECNVETSKGTREAVQVGGGCTLEQIKHGIETFWDKHFRGPSVPGRGERTYNYSLATGDLILAQGVSGTSESHTESCPL